jgi:transposase
MRGSIDDQSPLFHLFNVEDRIRADHPLRDIKLRVDRILTGMSSIFAKAYSTTGRPSVPPERLLKALLLMALDTVRSERQLCERIDTDLLFRGFLDLQPSDDAFDATTFTHNRKRLDDHHLTQTFFAAIVREAIAAGLCSEHFSVDGTMIESFASAKSFQPKKTSDDEPPDANGFKPRNAEVDFHGEKRTNETHQSRTDPEAKLHRKGLGKEAKLSHMGHALGENRNGLIVAITVTEANGTAERTAALAMLDGVKATQAVQPKTLGADKGFDSGEFFQELESRGIEPHVPLVKEPCDPETVAHGQRKAGVEARHRMKARQSSDGFRLSQKCRKKIEEVFGWLKEIAGLGRSRVVGRWKLQQLLEVGAAAFNLVRLRTRKPACVGR